MSAVIGMFRPGGGEADRAVLQRMLDTLAHRGPDGGGAWQGGPAGLGQQLHRVTAESPRDGRPLQVRDGTLVLAADARLDNRDELLGVLCNGSPQEEISDEALILKAYEKWGEACPEKLLGDFAFAIWDARESRFFCARDFPGVKPLYYFHGVCEGDELFLCASEIKALLGHPGVTNRLDEERIADYLAMVFEDRSATFFRDVRRLPPGCSMTVDRSGLRVRTYWALDPGLEIRHGSDEEYAERFREILDEAVASRRRSARPHGFLLSGGLDSSSIVCLARRHDGAYEGSPLVTFSASFRDFPQVDEQDFIDLVLAGGGIEPHYVRADTVGPLNDIDRVLRHTDEPFHAPNLFVFWLLAAKAREQGVSILIDGVDGDTTVSHGLERLIELVRTGRWGTLASEVKWLSRRFGHPGRLFLWHYGLKPGLIGPLVHRFASLAGREERYYAMRPATVRSDFARRIGWEERYRGLMRDRCRPIRSLKEGHWLTLTSGILPFYLEVHDKAAAAFGVDHRHPFYDRRLIEFCYGIPSGQKMSGGWDRVVQRRAMQDIVPAEIQWRIKKSHWGANFKRGFLEFDRASIEKILYEEFEIISEYADPGELGRAYERCRAGNVSQADGMNIWLAVSLALWLNKIENQSQLVYS